MECRIERIEIVSFGKLHDVALTLDEGINLLCAPNESGKSTLAAFVRFVLYGFADGRKRELAENDRKLFTPWDTPRSEGSLTVRKGEQVFRVTRSAVASGKETVSVTERLTGKTVAAGEIPGVFMFGVSEEVFSRTLFFKQSQPPSGRDDVLAEQLQNIAVSEQETVSAKHAVERLTKAKNELKGRGGNGWIPRLEEQYAQLSVELANAKTQQELLLQQRSDLERLQQQKQKNRADSLRVDEELRGLDKCDAAAKLEQLERIYKEASDKQEAYRQAADAVRSRGEDDVPFLSGLLAKQTEADAASVRAQNAQAQLTALQSEKPQGTTAQETTAQATPSPQKGFWAALALGILCLLGGGALLFLSQPLFGGVALGFGVVLIAAGLLWRTSARKKDAERQLEAERQASATCAAYTQWANLLRTVQETAEQEGSLAQKLQQEICDGLHSYGVTPDEHPTEQIRRLMQACMQLQAKRAAWESAASSYRLATEGMDLNALRTLADGATPAVRTRAEAERENSFLRQQRQGLEEKERRLETDIAAAEARAADPAALIGKRDAVERKLAECRKRFAAYEMAIGCIAEASDRMKSTVAPRVSATASRYFAAATNGKYPVLHADTRLALQTEANGIQRECEFLSAGTRDCVSLALRLALTDMLYGELQMPLLLDDTFGRLDDERLRSTLCMLGEAAETHQLLLLCCTTREKDMLERQGIPYRAAQGFTES